MPVAVHGDGRRANKKDSGGRRTVHMKQLARIRKRAPRRAAVRETHVYIAHS
jgi:hypothetical protein